MLLVLHRWLLHARDQILAWERVLGWLKKWVWRRFGKDYCYKFIGDGWIILLPCEFPAPDLLRKLRDLSQGLVNEYVKIIRPIYSRLHQTEPPYCGLTFGMDSGVLLRTRMINRPEYLGPPLNVASRLQGEAKNLRKNHAAGSLVASHRVYDEYLRGVEGYAWTKRAVHLRNIGDMDVWICKLAADG